MRSRGRLRWLRICWLVFVAWFVYVMAVPVGGSKTVTVLIPRGASAARISRILAEQGVIRSPLGFRMQVRITGRASKLKPGAYRLSPDMMPLKIIAMMSSGDTYARWITIPEGFTVRQIADRLAAEGLANEDRFLELALYGGSSFTTSFRHPGNSLEGYLFPDTYLIAPGTTEEAIIREMLSCFERKAASPMSADIARSGMSLRDLVTMASLIEREARVSKDRDLISGVLRNRLKR
ncbi:MAG: endolytic transglycosylase MltG, partial [Armatimonadetes bacterium]|nr:endolytic transglycosylase MltG [Armatimonadota bacterium]